VNKTFAALFAAVALAFASNAVAAAPAAPVTLPAKPGNVTFDHSKHAAVKCTVCHKDEKGGAIEGFNKTVNKDKAHAACQECHKKEGKGPTKCADCHKKA
jgi:cytochrome c553